MGRGIYKEKITTIAVSNQINSIIASSKENFVLLTAIFKSILNVNIPYVVKNMTACFSCETKSDSQIMSHTDINGPVSKYCSDFIQESGDKRGSIF